MENSIKRKVIKILGIAGECHKCNVGLMKKTYVEGLHKKGWWYLKCDNCGSIVT